MLVRLVWTEVNQYEGYNLTAYPVTILSRIDTLNGQFVPSILKLPFVQVIYKLSAVLIEHNDTIIIKHLEDKSVVVQCIDSFSLNNGARLVKLSKNVIRFSWRLEHSNQHLLY